VTERPTLLPDSPYPHRVVLSGVSKRFSSIRALDRVDLDLSGGEIHALCGENGAGKSTLIQILGGVFRADSGRIEIGGKPVRFKDPAAALAEGIGIIHQELNLVEPFTVAENLALGHEPKIGPWIDRQAIHLRARRLLENLQFDLDTKALVSGLTIGQRQQVEIAKALGREVRILVLDEPTAALSRAETDQLFRILRSLRARGLTILYVSHHLEEVFEIADRITVLRDGRRVGTWKTAELTLSQLVSAMVGEAVDIRSRPAGKVAAAPLLRVVGARGRILQGVDLEARPGEVVGLTGLAGAGHEELSATLFGAEPLAAGQIEWKNQPFQPRHPVDARRAGIAYVPPDRRGEGLIPPQGITENLTLAGLHELAVAGWISQAARLRRAETWCRRFDVAASRLSQRVTTLSGGNQQKVLLARWAALEPELFVLNEPTRGIDVKTREAVHRWIEDLVLAGRCVLLVSSDTQEMIRLADRCLVFRGGRVFCELEPPRLEEHTLIAAMMGG
jgi:ABC-type sugar transport system ATPase subunit